MGLIFTFFFFVGAVAILFLAAPLALLFVGYELAFDFVAAHWGALLIVALAASVLINLVPVRRGENKTFISATGETYTAKNYAEFIIGLAALSFFALVLAQLF
nr:MAG TPA: hypothetical protein [Caudoviricetes sp.]